jgi:rod shape-determining protein MreC
VFATRASRRRGLVYAVFVAASLVLLALSRNPMMLELRRGFGFAFAPIQGVFSGITRVGLDVADAITEIDRLRAENRRLQAENQELAVENARTGDLRFQYNRLADLLKVQSRLEYDSVAAEVIGRQITQYERVMTINQGTDAGISVQDVVVGGGAALVGQVVEVGPNFSRILLISDTRSTVIGLVETSRATGEVQGQLGGSLVMTKIPSTDELAIDDTVVTAGIDLGDGIRSPFPKGLVVGRIVDVDRDPNAVVQTAFIEAAAPLDKLEYVLVIIDYEGGVPIDRGPSPSPAPSGGSGEESPSPSGATPSDEIPLPSPTTEPLP